MADKAITRDTRVKLILDKEESFDNRWSGETGTVTDIIFDDADSVTGESEDNMMLEVELDAEDKEIPEGVHFRRQDVKVLDE